MAKKQSKSERFNPKHELAVGFFKEKLLAGEPFEVKDILRQAGYAESTVEQSEKVMQYIKPKLQDTVHQMERIRQKAMDRLEDQIERAHVEDVIRAVNVLTKNIQLLTGGATQNVAGIIDDQSRAKSDDAIRQYLNSRNS